MKIRLGTRGSRLALVQSEAVAAGLRARGAEVELVVIRTSGDRLAQVALADFGGKALFVKEIEEALLAGQVDVGVYSLKDMPSGRRPLSRSQLAREDPCDVPLGRRGRVGRCRARWCISSPRLRDGSAAGFAPSRSAATWTRVWKIRAGLRRAHHGRRGAGRLGPPAARRLDPAEFVPVGRGAVEPADREPLVLRA
jgi:hypothetical protein